MTKLKNTKKGMAKKALSISLVAAMLATSNVPVWAAEDLFTDGSSAAVEAPVVEEPAAEVEAFSAEPDASAEENQNTNTLATGVVESGDLILNDLKVSSSATFAQGKVDVSGKIYIKGTGSEEAKELTNYDFGWRVQGETAAIFTDTVASNNNSSKMSFTPDFANASGDTHSQAQYVDWSKYVGKTLELYIYNNEDSTDATKIDPTVIATTIINKCDMTGSTLRLNKTSESLVYNGKTYQYTDTESGDNNVSLNTDTTMGALVASATGDKGPGTANIWTKEDVLKYFDVSASTTALNAGDKITVTATAKADSPYSGTIYAETLTVQKRPFVASEFIAAINSGLLYQYTGKQISVDTEDVSFKESSALSGADLSSAIVKAWTQKNTIGESTVTVQLKKSALGNFDFDNAIYTDPNYITVETLSGSTSAKATITKRDLSADSTNISLKYGRVPYNTTVEQFANDHLIFTDKDGTSLNLKNNEDYVLTIKDPDNQTVSSTGTLNKIGTYTVTIAAKESTQPTCYNGQTFEVRVASNVIWKVTYENDYAPYYTGADIEPTQTDLGKITIVNVSGSEPSETLKNDEWEIIGYSNNTNASTYVNGEAVTFGYVQIRIKGDSSYAGQTFDVPFEIKPLTVSESSVTVPKTVTYNKGYGPAKDYNVQLIVTGKDKSGKIVKGLSTDDYTVDYEYTNVNGKSGNELHNFIKATITITNPNYMGENGNTVKIEMISTNKHTEIVEKALTSSMIQFTPDSYTYTGGNIVPEYVVLDGAYPLYEDEDYTVESITDNLNVGKGKVTIKGIEGHYYGTASAEFDITPADTADVKVEFTNLDECKYTGRTVRPRTFKATLNGNDVTSQFEIVSYGENINGTGTVVLRPVDGNKNFTGDNITVEFEIIKEIVKGSIDLYNSNGEKVTGDYAIADPDATVTDFNQSSFEFDGTEKTFAEEILTLAGDTKATVDDFEIKYVDNVSGAASNISDSKKGKYNVAYVYAVAKEGTGYTGADQIVTADGTTIKGVVAMVPFAIKNVYFNAQNVSVKNATYAGGLPVKPEVLVQVKGVTLVEGKDYELQLSGAAAGENYNNVTDGAVYSVKVVGIGGYIGSSATAKWGIDKKDIADCDVAVTNGVVTVMNGYIPVPVTEYTSKNNGDGTYTITANAASKSYVGSKTVTAEGQAEDEKPDAPMIQEVRVNGNNATVVLSGETEGATGYDYVISTDRDCINSKDYDKVNKNILGTETTFTYTQQGVYYAYCHAWKRVDGVKVFSEWSNAYPFVVSAITPEQPVITSVKKSGRNLTVTWTKSANATTGYDIVMGTEMKKVNGEMRPVEYGKAVKKLGPNTFSVTFKSIPKGTYYVALHAHNRTSESGVKVFSPWSNAKKVTF